MIQLVRDDKAPLGDEGGNDRGVGRKTHRGNESILVANETSNQGFCGRVHLRRATFETGTTSRDAVTTKALLNCVCTSTLSGSKAKVVVRRNVESTRRRSRKEKGIVVIVRVTVEESDCSSRDASDRRGETVIDTCFEPSGVKGVKIRIKGSITLGDE
jgi:hypothetical protein